MKKLPPSVPFNWTIDGTMTARYAPIHHMVTDVLVRTEPGLYASLLQELRAEWHPAGAEVRLVEMMAGLACCLRGCLYLETELLNQGMQACAAPDVPSEVALGRAYARDSEGPKLLEKLSRYHRRLSREFSRCVRILQLGAKKPQIRGGQDGQRAFAAQALHFRYTIGCAVPALHLPPRSVWLRLGPALPLPAPVGLSEFSCKEVCV